MKIITYLINRFLPIKIGPLKHIYKYNKPSVRCWKCNKSVKTYRLKPVERCERRYSVDYYCPDCNELIHIFISKEKVIP